MLYTDGSLSNRLLESKVGTGEKIETKILSMKPDYAIDFASIQGFIEIVQNALDVMLINNKDADIYSTFDKIVVANSGPSLGIADFDLGETTKRDDVGYFLPKGYFGTGLSKSLCVLFRTGYSLKIYTIYGLYIPELVSVADEKYGKISRIAISTYDYKLPEGTVIEIRGGEIRMQAEELNFRVLELRKSKIIKFDYSWVEFIDEPVKLDDKGVPKLLSDGYHRGIFITTINSLFHYNFGRRELMKQESRNSFTSSWTPGYKEYISTADEIGRFWRTVDDINLIKKYIDFRIRTTASCHEDNLREHPLMERNKLWRDAWNQLYPGKYITTSEFVVKINIDLATGLSKFIKVPEALYIILKNAGVPSEISAGIENVIIVRYTPSRSELERLDKAIMIASLFAGKKTPESLELRKKLKEVLSRNIYSQAKIVDKQGKEEDKTGEWAFVWENDINRLYVRDDAIKSFNEIRIATIILHELAHTRKTGGLFETPEGFSHENMYRYYELILADLFDIVSSKKLIDLFKEIERGK